MNVESELSTIAREYSSYFPKCNLVPEKRSYYPLKTEPWHLAITTKEEKSVKVTVSVAGWSLTDSEQYFQTFEALMNHESPQFRHSFADALTQKLALISEG
ncbi:hypothetical protein EJF18_80098 [Clavispora lusitaniae]|uniref:GSKIP domain-containing protein n=3 Tax=Clavispora lusitaniae TaxID=36911 RepID=C4YC23_CLAL4|nr:uncharacterized protein CLUG_05840 [Clavispora lusitaniae ATCC 42720]KAF5208676.1 hypothetical protein E0198_005182 [Clavispora lusitaniae]EEQ41712.1 predicted protein [Clavispora lusitaniae ATCC 42720]KAF7580507.1 hypothetical protein FOB63_004445 [Clavispora lusitaniae]OVF09317.1 hypothetical protein A9F13_05g01100 [Clavispora lusitaniae]QFZ30381.1 hypothetical protein EJF14_80098 [Clavispora lusitaniae]